MVGGEQRRADQPRDDESGNHPAGRLDPEKKSRRASERDETKRAVWREQARDVDPARFVWVDETGSDLGMTRPYSRAPRGQRAYGDVPGRRGKNRTLITALTVDGFGPGLLLDEAIDRAAFDAYVIHRLAPTLKADQIVVVDNLKVHYSDRAKSAIEARGAQLWYLPAYSPDLTPIEEAFSKFKGVLRTSAPRTVEAHSTAVWAALRTITSQDAAGWIAHAGYGPRRRRPKRSPRRRPAPLPPSRFPDAPPVITLQVPTPILFDHLW
ncbi:MAG: IS630 family transposase [Chloroflexota bacterium]